MAHLIDKYATREGKLLLEQLPVKNISLIDMLMKALKEQQRAKLLLKIQNKGSKTIEGTLNDYLTLIELHNTDRALPKSGSIMKHGSVSDIKCLNDKKDALATLRFRNYSNQSV